MEKMLQEDLKISVIVPVYHVEDYIEKCIKSICQQTYKNIEIILVDDFSKDRSGIICDEYSRKDERIKVIHQSQNGGPSLARNMGMAQAEGEYYLFVDGDDWIEETLCERAVGALKSRESEIDTVHWGYCCVDRGGRSYQKNIRLFTQKRQYPKQIFLMNF